MPPNTTKTPEYTSNEPPHKKPGVPIQSSLQPCPAQRECVIMYAECMHASLWRRNPPQPTFNSDTSHVEMNYRFSLECSLQVPQSVIAFVPE